MVVWLSETDTESNKGKKNAIFSTSNKFFFSCTWLLKIPLDIPNTQPNTITLKNNSSF